LKNCFFEKNTSAGISRAAEVSETWIQEELQGQSVGGGDEEGALGVTSHA
jgi:hypothetical protein